MTFRDRLVATIRAARPVLELPDILVVGSEVPNLLQPAVAATLVVSLDLDIGVPIERHASVKAALDQLSEFQPSREEPSVWVPRRAELLEINFLGIDRSRPPLDVYVHEDDRLPLLVFGALSLVQAGRSIDLEGVRVLLPEPAGLLLEKLVTDRSGEKGERDLLVALGLLTLAHEDDLAALERDYRSLPADLRHVVRGNLTVLSLLGARDGMPDPAAHRGHVAALLARLEAHGEEA